MLEFFRFYLSNAHHVFSEGSQTKGLCNLGNPMTLTSTQGDKLRLKFDSFFQLV